VVAQLRSQGQRSRPPQRPRRVDGSARRFDLVVTDRACPRWARSGGGAVGVDAGTPVIMLTGFVRPMEARRSPAGVHHRQQARHARACPGHPEGHSSYCVIARRGGNVRLDATEGHD